MYRDLGFIRVWGTLAEAPERRRHAGDAAAGAPYAYLIYPHKPIVAYLPADRRAAERVLRRVPGRDAALRQRAAAGLRRRAGQVDGAHRRRAAPDRAGQHAPARPPGRPQAGPPRPLAPAPVGARASRASAPPRAEGSRPGARERRTLPRRSTSSTAAAPSPRVPSAPPRAPTCKGIGFGDEELPSRSSASRTRGSRRCRATSTTACSPRRSRRASARPAARRWSSTRSRSPTASRWAPAGCGRRSSRAS